MKRVVVPGGNLLLIGCCMLFLAACRKKGEEREAYHSQPVSFSFAERLASRLSLTELQTGGMHRTAAGEAERIISSSFTIPDTSGLPALYVFNYAGNSGFAILSADWCHEPLCALTSRGSLGKDTVPSGLADWLEATVENIELVRSGGVANKERASLAWRALLRETALPLPEELPQPPEEPTSSPCEMSWQVSLRGPLLRTAWGQRCSYNERLPLADCMDACGVGRPAPTGCIATAVSQLMAYWRHPSGYAWESMPPEEGNAEVQRLMADAGRSVGTRYGCTLSVAPFGAIAPALRASFGYASAIGGAYGGSSHQDLIRNIDRGQPVILGGCSGRRNVFLGLIHRYSDCHVWVCDGYWQLRNGCYTHLFLHMNWGWQERGSMQEYNGWFLHNYWNPEGRQFRYAQEWVSNIRP